MQEMDIAIVGGGLCGLALATSLHAQGLDFAVFEARPRLGGRIRSVEAQSNGLALDLGAAWYWPQSQPRMARLVETLGLGRYPQHDRGRVLSLAGPEVAPVALEVEGLHDGAWRIEGGTASLVAALAARLPSQVLNADHVLVGVRDAGDRLELALRNGDRTIAVRARQVVLALPPRLVEERVDFQPPLNGQVREVLRETATWMAAQAKLGVAFGAPDGVDAQGMGRAAFWRDEGLSGSGQARYPRSVLGEVHDACDALGCRAGLSAFFALEPAARSLFRSGLGLLADSQLGQWFGPRAQGGEQHRVDWAEETWTCSGLDRTTAGDLSAMDHPTSAHPVLRLPAWNGRLHFGGSETAAQGAGYMEGALEAAARLRHEILVTQAALTRTELPCAY